VSNACTCENGQKADRFARFSNSAVWNLLVGRRASHA